MKPYKEVIDCLRCHIGDSEHFYRGTLSIDQYRLEIAIDQDSIAEDAGLGAASGVVSRFSADISLPLTVALGSDREDELTPQTTVTIPAGQSSVARQKTSWSY